LNINSEDDSEKNAEMSLKEFIFDIAENQEYDKYEIVYHQYDIIL
jgi:hypothetical protein